MQVSGLGFWWWWRLRCGGVFFGYLLVKGLSKGERERWICGAVRCVSSGLAFGLAFRCGYECFSLPWVCVLGGMERRDVVVLAGEVSVGGLVGTGAGIRFDLSTWEDGLQFGFFESKAR